MRIFRLVFVVAFVVLLSIIPSAAADHGCSPQQGALTYMICSTADAAEEWLGGAGMKPVPDHPPPYDEKCIIYQPPVGTWVCLE